LVDVLHELFVEAALLVETQDVKKMVVRDDAHLNHNETQGDVFAAVYVAPPLLAKGGKDLPGCGKSHPDSKGTERLGVTHDRKL
jgi:hypothetical protein